MFLLLQFPLTAQNIEFGSGARFIKMKGEIFSEQYNSYFPVDPDPQLSFNITGSGNIPLKYFKDEVVAGINPNAALSLFYTSIALDIPVFLTLKLGSGSSRNSEAVLGSGIGVGGQFSFFSTTLNATYAAVNYSTAMLVPVVMGEASITFQGYNMYQLRVEFTPVSVQKTNAFQGQISMLTIRLMRAFF